METDEQELFLPFQLQFDKPVASQIKIAEWNPKKDLLAMVAEDSKILLHRFNWQRLWTISPGRCITSLCWRPDGKAIVVGLEDGTISLHDVENGKLLRSLKSHNVAVVCLNWEEEGQLNRNDNCSFSTFEDRTPRFFPPAPRAPRMPWIVSGDAGFMDNDDDSYEELSSSSYQRFNILCSGDKYGSICFSIFGIFPIGKIVALLKDLCRLIVICSGELNEKSVESRKCQVSGLGMHGLVLDTFIFWMRKNELHQLAQQASNIEDLTEVMRASMSVVLKQWSDAMRTFREKFDSLSTLIIDHALDSSPQEEFLSLLGGARTSPAVHQFLVNGIGELGVKRVSKVVGGAGKELQRIVLDHLQACNHVTTADDVEEWVYHQLEDTTHLLHGVVHANGHGHLLRVNGREGGSKVLSGRQIMDFWDRLCKTLGVRKVSVMDVSKKYGLEYRLLHAITKGHPWYGDWGYEFGAGSFALTGDAYKSAVQTLSNLPLSIFLSKGCKPTSRLQDVISFYQSLSDRELVNTRDLFCYLISLICDAHKSNSSVDDSSCKRRRFFVSETSPSWSSSDMKRVDEAMFRVLRAVSGSNWVSWRTLRGAVCKVAVPELLDLCLKELGGKPAADGMIVSTQCNPDSGLFEYRLEPGSSALNDAAGIDVGSSVVTCPSQEKLILDLRFLYEHMLRPQTMVHGGPESMDVGISSVEKLLDCKQFVKDYKPERRSLTNPLAICVSCEVDMIDTSEESVPPVLPPEPIILPQNATVYELKLEASRAFQDVYLMFRRFQVEEVVGYSGVDDSTQVKSLLGSTASVKVRGRCLGKNGLNKFRMERGLERWTVDCSCGAKDDDGERMLACDVCGVWRYTRCSGIPDSDSVPFLDSSTFPRLREK